MSGPLLDVTDLSVTFNTPHGALRAVDNVSFSLGEGEVLGLVGESGSGKTVTCRALMRLLPSRHALITTGTAFLEGTDIFALPDAEMAHVRGEKIGMIFQNPASHLDPVMTVGNQIAEALRFHEGTPRREARREAVAMLRQVGIPDPETRLDSYPHEFSGGMRQRAMIAAALVRKPKILIADEPTTALDVTVQAQILRLLLDLRDEIGLSIILITHDLGVVAQTCDNVAVMYGGRIVERASKRTVLRQPLHPYTEGLLGSQPGAAPPLADLPSIPGQPPSLSDALVGCRFHPRCGRVSPICLNEPPALVEVAPAHQSACLHWQALAEPA